jgi:hypothetical protein
MHSEELPTTGLHGTYRDVLYDEAGRVTWDGDWRKNVITADCRRLLAALMCKDPLANPTGILGVKFGQGNPTWDASSTGPPQPTATDKLFDQLPYSVTPASTPPLVFQYIVPGTVGTVSVNPTNILQIIATLGVGQPPWPEAGPNPPHVDETLREFGLFAHLQGNDVLVNLVRHIAIPKDPASTLVRTIQLVF